MCGIVGIVRLDGMAVNQEELERLNQALYHRGPDEDGTYIDGCVGLAMRRLSIIDLTSGSQPMTSPDGSLVIVFNGEIYNYREVRDELKHLGHSFRTNSDTEVILEGYREWGDDVLSHLNGMWGIAIFDRASQQIFLSRDRLGKKQIYYALNREYLVFGSEMKIPMMYDTRNRKLRLSALAEYLTYGYIGAPETAVEGIYSLPEASWMKLNLANGRYNIHEYWSINPPDSPETNFCNEAEASEAAYSLLCDAVRQRLVSDVPLSVMLSSGLDSSACAYILSQELSAPLMTFSLGYSDMDFDESADAGAFAGKMGMPWQRSLITGSDIVNVFPDFIRHCDSLQANTAQLVYYFVNRNIHHEGYKVALNGSGGDELFAGYTTYQADSLFRIYRRFPAFITNALHYAANRLPPKLGRVSLDYMLKKYTEVPYNSPLQAHAYWRTMFSRQGLAELMQPDLADIYPSFTRIYDYAYHQIGSSVERINGILYADLKAWLIPMLPWVDNMAMAHSVELRLPFLDYRLVQLALSMPPQYLFNGWGLKKMMKRFLKNRLPDEVLYRRKRGTHLPVSRWLNDELVGIKEHYLDSSVLNKEGLFDDRVVRRMVNEHRQLTADHTFRLWNLMVFSAWKESNGITV